LRYLARRLLGLMYLPLILLMLTDPAILFFYERYLTIVLGCITDPSILLRSMRYLPIRLLLLTYPPIVLNRSTFYQNPHKRIIEFENNSFCTALIKGAKSFMRKTLYSSNLIPKRSVKMARTIKS
jgi:hypothetical protein